jgi:hypothetical protein
MVILKLFDKTPFASPKSLTNTKSKSLYFLGKEHTTYILILGLWHLYKAWVFAFEVKNTLTRKNKGYGWFLEVLELHIYTLLWN